MSNKHLRTLATALAATAGLASLANAQSLLQTNGRVIATNDGQVPGLAAGIVFGGTSTFDIPCITESGDVLFRGRFTDPTGLLGVTPLNDRAIFVGSTAGSLAILARGSDAAPGLPGVTMNTGTTTQVGGSPRFSADGDTFWCAPLSGAGVTTANDTAIFGGPVGSLALFVREGDAAPGTVGATFSSSLSNLSHQPTGINSAGRILFQSSTLGGDTATSNNAGWWTGAPGALELVQRKGDTVLGGAVVSALGFISQMNESGQVLHDESLSTTLGTTPATTANDKTLFVYTPGVGNALVLREGDSAPGTASALFANSSSSWSVSTAANTFNASGNTLLNLELFSGDVLSGVNDRGLYYGGTSGLTLILRKGDNVPSLPGVTYGNVNTSSMCLVNSGRIAFQCALAGGGITTANDGVIMTGDANNPSSLQIIVREGDPAPGTVGATISGFLAQSMQLSPRGQIVFLCDFAGGDTGASNFAGAYLWDPQSGLHLLNRYNDSLEVRPGVFKSTTSTGTLQFNNGNGSPLNFNSKGQLVTRQNFSDGSAAIIVVDPPNSSMSFCAGDGIATDHTTPCPCGNNGAAGNGCANSTNVNGANCALTGSTFLDTATLSASGMPATSSCIYLQGDALDDTTFGDGVRCTGGSLIRLRTRINVAGASTFPDSTDTITLSARGGVTPGSGDRRYYQVYYRNAAGLFCPPETFNVSNGVVIDW
ncbi:MAG: hypothetical protein IPJ77_04890 [Planctomycetes bacterium]|nr:hypothetical protein [Planctomycetota bacterium]